MANIFAFAAVALLTFGTIARAEAITVKHPQGETVIKAVPKTVIVTDWAAFDNLSALGIAVEGVPSSTAPPYLADKLRPDMLRVGSLQEPDIEAIAAAAPDLVIVAARSRTAYPTLSRLGPTIDVSVDNDALIEDVKANVVTLGRVFGREKRAAELVAALDRKVEQARKAVAGKGTGLVIVTNGGKMGIYGPTSRIAWIYRTLNVPGVFDKVDDSAHAGDAITFEYLLQHNPDWLFVIDRDAGIGQGSGAARKLLDNELIHKTGFWKNDRIIYLDPAASYVTMHGYGAIMLLLDQVIAGYAKP